MAKVELNKTLYSVMRGNISIKTNTIQKMSFCSINKYKTESITQAKDYGKLE